MKKSNELNKNDQVQRQGKKYRNRSKIENESRDEVNEGTLQESDKTADNNDEKVDTNMQIVRIKNPLE